MSQLITDNKQLMVHIASEVVVLVAITFYFNQKNKKLTSHIENLAQRVEEQEDLLQKHGQMIKRLINYVTQQQNLSRQRQQIVQEPVKKQVRRTRVKKHNAKKSLSPSKVRVHFETDINEVKPSVENSLDEDKDKDKDKDKDENENESDSDLDAEIAAELKDLVDLKKEVKINKENA